MQLKSLQIQGFKSFPDKTKLEFSDGITAVVGPNGSGKSNISDAMRWVLGEQSTKTLRGGKMEDVIFVGTKERKQTGFASVELTVDNRDRRLPMDTDEITVCRKLYRSGDSEYRINNTSVRLKDVNELFMDTGLGRDGYCIIGQGKIAEIVDAKSVHRREIFEEAAGISKFRYRKEEAEKKLAASYENLVRLKDILLELEGRIEPLKVQSEKAEQFVKYANEKKSLEITLWLEKIEEFREKISQQEQILLVNRTEYEDNSTLLEDVEYQIGEVYKQIQQADIETEKIRERLLNNDSEISECNSKLAVAQNDILHNCNSVKSLADDIAMQQTDSNSLDLQIKQKQQEIADEKQKYIEQKQHNENILHKLNEIKIQEEQQTQKFAQLKNKYTATEKALNEQNLKKATSASLLEETKSRLSGMEQISQNQESILDEIKAEIKRCEDFVALLDENIASDTNALKGYEMKLASRNEGLNTLLGEQTKLFTDAKTADERRKMLLDMEKNMEGLDGSVKYVLRQAANGELRGIHGTVSKFISADSKIAVAIETALGAALQNIIVNDEYSAKAAMELLKKSNQGRATFLPLNAVKGKTVNEQGVELCEGYVGIAAELVKYEDKYKGIVLNLLGRTVIAEDVNCGISIAKEFGSRFKIVTLDGQVLNQGGSMTGGSVSQKAGILSRRTEIDRLSEKVNILTEKADAMEDTIKVAKEHSDKISAQISAISGQIKTCNEDKITASAELKRYTFNYDDAVKNMKNVEKEYQSLKLRIELLSVETSDKDDIVKKLESEAILLSVYREL
ncbi:MAG: chromosome segregation protein SMC [Oscillospiraceae bacterium]